MSSISAIMCAHIREEAQRKRKAITESEREKSDNDHTSSTDRVDE